MKQVSLDDAVCGYFSFSDQGTILYVNSTLCKLLDYRLEELIEKNVESILTLPTRIFYQTHFFPLLKLKGSAEEIFVSLLSKDGAYVPVLLNAKRTTDPETVNSCAFIVVENRKKFEDELIAAKKAAEKSLAENVELKETKSELQAQAIHLDHQINLVSKHNNELKQINHATTHTLKEAIRKIHLYAQRIDEMNTDKEIDRHLKNLLNASSKMQRAVTALQQFIWLNEIATEYNEVNLNTIIEDTLSNKFADRKDLLNIDCESLPIINADERQIRIMFESLFSNAIKFRNGGPAQVTITGSLIRKNSFKHLENKYIYIEYLKLGIKDNGHGFDPAYALEVFELFKKFHHGEGDGVGLAICKKVVENHSGTIRADSKLNEYTLIEIMIPTN